MEENNKQLATSCINNLIQLIKDSDIGNIKADISDGYHTFAELYEFRKQYNAALFNLLHECGYSDVHKSYRHHDGELCFGGMYFIVVAILPSGQISNHYKIGDWDLFNIPAYETARYEFDGHTPQDVINRLHEVNMSYKCLTKI